ncbi:MAG: flagellar type III secretion system protein FliR [Beijerinckiaceae bacterium]|nr:flagellar type III secretion system protein FliR [Beijerinckiaceae bacterium]
MTAIGPDAVLSAFVFFCRIGGCLMLMPGFSSSRIPASVRLFMAFSVTLALMPLLSGEVAKSLAQDAPAALIRLFISETLIGALIGFLARIFFGALETLCGVIAMSIGLTSALAGPMEENEPLPVITTFIILSATALVFFTDLHWEVLRGIIESYSVLPVSGLFDARFNLVQVTDCLTKSFFIALRISSPFIVYALITNLTIGLASKLVPQIPIYFITIPAVIAGGLALFYLTCKPFMLIFNEAFAKWLVAG